MPKRALPFILLAVSCAHVRDVAERTVVDIGVIEHVREDWATYWNAKNVADIMKLYAPDAVFLRPNAARTTGTPAIRALFESVLATNTPHIEFHGITIEGSDDLAYDSGTYDETITTGGVTRKTKGDYLIVVKRQANGRWLIVQQAWSDATNGQ